MKVKEYVSVYDDNKKDKKVILESTKNSFVEAKKAFNKAKTGLAKIKESLKKIKEEDDEATPVETADAIEDAIDKVEDIVQDLIDDVGVAEPAVDALIDTAKELEVAADVAEVVPEA